MAKSEKEQLHITRLVAMEAANDLMIAGRIQPDKLEVEAGLFTDWIVNKAKGNENAGKICSNVLRRAVEQCVAGLIDECAIIRKAEELGRFIYKGYWNKRANE